MDCAGCGDCCEVVWMTLGPDGLEELRGLLDAGRGLDEQRRRDVAFYLEHFHPIPPAEAGDGSAPAELAVRAGMRPWRCDKFDAETRLCTAHDSRPSLCQGYPWYRGHPWGKGEPTAADGPLLPARCSHRWDVPPAGRGELAGRLLPLWPVLTSGDDKEGARA